MVRVREIMDTRPKHQQQLEQAHNAGNYVRVKAIIDRMPRNDPYRTPMTSLFADDIKQAKQRRPR